MPVYFGVAVRSAFGNVGAARTGMVGSTEPHFAGVTLMHPGCPIEQVYLCRESIDFRKAINGLSVMVEQELGLNPFGSALYVFVNRSRNKIKVLYWHRNGFCLWQKRLEEEKFHWPKHSETDTQTITIREFAVVA